MKYTLIILISLISCVTMAQGNLATYTVERENLYHLNKDFSASDRAFVAANSEILPALVKKETAAQLVIFTYRTFRNLNVSNEQNVMSRLKRSVPSIVSISNIGNEIKVSFTNPISEEDLTELFRLTGFKGYKIMNTP